MLLLEIAGIAFRFWIVSLGRKTRDVRTVHQVFKKTGKQVDVPFN